MQGSDEQLMLSYRDGDASAFDRLYARHRGPLFRFVRRSVPDRALAEEIYQEVWMRAIEARTRYEPRAKFTTWLYTIAHNRLVDHWRRRGLALVSADGDDANGEPLDPPGSAADDPLRRVEGKRRLERFARALEALPSAQRAAFLLSEEAGLSVAEIAKATGSNEDAAKSRLRYATAKLRQAIDDE
jgi:RNA polymerase sigma-70 factor (ECF subfamily)